MPELYTAIPGGGDCAVGREGDFVAATRHAPDETAVKPPQLDEAGVISRRNRRSEVLAIGRDGDMACRADGADKRAVGEREQARAAWIGGDEQLTVGRVAD